MRLRLLLPLLCTASACFLLVEEEEAAPSQEGQGGWGGVAPPVCTGDEAIDCAGRSCGDTIDCAGAGLLTCTTPCEGWRRLPVEEGARPSGFQGHAAICDEARGVVWVFGGTWVDKTIEQPVGDYWPPTSQAALWKLTPGAAGGVVWTLAWGNDPQEPFPVPGVGPSPRYRAALLLAEDGDPVVVGGALPSTSDRAFRADQEVSPEAWRFDTETGAFEGLADAPALVAAEVVPGTPWGTLLLGGFHALPPGQGSNEAWIWDPVDGSFEQASTRLYPIDDPARVPILGASLFAPALGVLHLGGTLAGVEDCTDHPDEPNFCNVYDEAAYRLTGEPPELHFEPLAALAPPAPRQEFGAAVRSDGELVLYDGWWKWRQPRDPPRDVTWLSSGNGWVESVGANDWRAFVDGAAGNHPADRKSYSMFHCAPFGGVLLIGGEEAVQAPDARVFLLPDPPP